MWEQCREWKKAKKLSDRPVSMTAHSILVELLLICLLVYLDVQKEAR